MHHSFGKILMIFDAFLLISGAIIYFFGDKFSWQGRLPGDIRIENENTKIFIPITTMIIISLLLTLIINLIRRIF